MKTNFIKCFSVAVIALFIVVIFSPGLVRAQEGDYYGNDTSGSSGDYYGNDYGAGTSNDYYGNDYSTSNSSGCCDSYGNSTGGSSSDYYGNDYGAGTSNDYYGNDYGTSNSDVCCDSTYSYPTSNSGYNYSTGCCSSGGYSYGSDSGYNYGCSSCYSSPSYSSPSYVYGPSSYTYPTTPIVTPSTNTNNVNTNTNTNVNTIINTPPAAAPVVQQQVPQLSVSCYGTPSNARINDSVAWVAQVSGGNGSYSYSWSGSDGLSGGGQTISRFYGTGGSKIATVNVVSDGQSQSASCSIFVQTPVQQNPQPTQAPLLDGYCQASPSSVETGDQVRWTAYPSGGTGNYSYDWSGTNSLNGSGKTVYKTYSSTGSKDATVRITSDGQTITRDCSVDVNRQYNYNNDNNGSLSISCYPDQTQVPVGRSVTWRSSVDGGDGDYSYRWTGTDGLSSRSRTDSETYDTPGVKSATLRVTDGNGDSDTQNCGSVYVVGAIAPYYQPPIIPQPLSSAVYLSQVPYTGANTWKIVAFLSVLAFGSIITAYFIVRRKAMNEQSLALEAKRAIEDHARENKVLLSEDALQYLVAKAKAEKKIALSVLQEVIKNVKNSGEWATVTKNKIVGLNA